VRAGEFLSPDAPESTPNPLENRVGGWAFRPKHEALKCRGLGFQPVSGRPGQFPFEFRSFQEGAVDEETAYSTMCTGVLNARPLKPRASESSSQMQTLIVLRNLFER
jgi:hypothetical protein